jgi:plasmid stability protein
MNIKIKIEDAIKRNLVLKVAYHGGSQPGAVREILPLSIKDEKVRAMCHTSNAVKVFFINKLVLIDGESTNMHKWSENPEPKYKSIPDLLGKINQNLLDLGWYVSYEKDDESENVHLHRRFKNGVPLKSSDVSLRYFKYMYQPNHNIETGNFDEIKTINKRPWSAIGKNHSGKAFKNLDKAAEYFIELSKKLDTKSYRKSKK